MSYAIYTTRGFILGSAPSGEAGKTYLIYTELFGLVRASAIGVRHLKSKLRYSLDDFSGGTYSLVRGKEFWRLTGAEKDPVLSEKGEAKRIRARVLNLVRRLVHGEERNDALFGALSSMDEHLRDGFREESATAVEAVALLRALSSLGYAGAAATSDLLSGPITGETVSLAQKRLPELLREIHRAMKESQL